MTADEIFNHWKVEVQREQGGRFTKANRPKLLDMLFEFLIQNNVTEEEAGFLKFQVKKVLVTNEGMKGKGRHANWKENVDDEFDHALVKYYGNLNELNTTTQVIEVNKKQTYGEGPYLAKNEIITTWAQSRFRSAWNEDLNLMAHMIGHVFNMEFQKEMFDN